ncbi:MAG: hypothetical protein QM820_44925 [Minicystis sp.]
MRDANAILVIILRVLGAAGCGAWMATALASCGGKVVVDAASAASSGAGGANASTSSSASGTSGGPGGAGGGAPVACGAQVGVTCPPDQFCDFSDDSCGNDQIAGVCTPRPLACPPVFIPTCGCDAITHNTPCDANREGTDQSVLHLCVAPAGMFQCGAFFCTVGKEYCETHTSQENGPISFECLPPPPSCGGDLSCDCLLGKTCGTACGGTPEGGTDIFCAGP